MCLIAYVPEGKALKREVFDNANRINPHGIGVMSIEGVEKFFGNKQLKRARQYAAELANKGIAHAVHWRFATHGTKGLALCHPFKLPNANVWLMHNGVIGATSAQATEDASDTLLYVNSLTDAPVEYPADLEYWTKVATHIGRYNKGLVMYPNGKFIILNQDDGCTVEDIWYSNSYSLPYSMRPTTGSNFMPSRLMPQRPTSYHSPRRDYYETGTRANDFGGPYGSLIYWSMQMKSYGYWEGMKFIKLHITEGEVIDTRVPPDQSNRWQDTAKEASISVDLKTGEITDTRKCVRCGRFKEKVDCPQGFLPCWCRQEDVQDYIARQKAKLDAAHPSGPTLGEDRPTSKLPADQCEHGNSSWEDCKECIDELEQDNTSEVQRWLAHRAGYRLRSTNPDERAQELADNVIYLPRASDK